MQRGLTINAAELTGLLIVTLLTIEQYRQRTINDEKEKHN